VCVFIHLLHSSLVLFILGVLGLWEFLLAGRVIFSFCVGLRCVECRAGTIYLSASLGWVAGLYRFSSFWLCCGEYGTIYFSAGRGVCGGAVQVFFWCYLLVLCVLSC
jgi:ABC-type amino acid transport system permease subunit